jgi:hypothetical protein
MLVLVPNHLIIVPFASRNGTAHLDPPMSSIRGTDAEFHV